ncbi:MAG: phosphatidylinositol kinase [Acidimicrobiia bacterium]|nr:phosphatidylinositol kinase [Acidimicrobiia bacterium]
MTSTGPAIVNVVGRMPYASNATLLVDLDDGHQGIYKPADGERPLWDFPFGTLAAREVLTWEVSAAMGLSIVPPTYLVEGPFGLGSTQLFIKEDFEFDPRPLLEEPSERLWPFAVLDVIINNADRKLGHIIVEESTHDLWAIDNGLSFHYEEKLRTILWGFAGRPLPAPLIKGLTNLTDSLKSGLHARVSDLLSRVEADALATRTAHLLESGVHPHPPLDRPAVPWPMW